MNSYLFEDELHFSLSFPQQSAQTFSEKLEFFEEEKQSRTNILRSSKSIKKLPKENQNKKTKVKDLKKLNTLIEGLASQLIECLDIPSSSISIKAKEKLRTLSEKVSRITTEEIQSSGKKNTEYYAFETPSIKTHQFCFEDLLEASDRSDGRAHSDDLTVEKKYCDAADIFITYRSEPGKSPELTIETDEIDFRQTDLDEGYSVVEESAIMKDNSEISEWKVSEYLKRGKIRYPGEVRYQALVEKILDIYRSNSKNLAMIETATQKRYIPQTMSLFANSVLQGYFPDLEILKISNKPFYDKLREFVKEKIKGKQEKTNRDGKAVKDARITKIEQMRKLFRDPNTINKFLRQLLIQFFQSEDMIWLKALLELSHAKPEGKIWFILNKWSIEKVCFDEMGRGDFDPVFLPLDSADGEILDEKRHQFFSQLINSLT